MPPVIGNIFAGLPSAGADEVVETIAEVGVVRIERIVSRGQATPDGEWYEQEQDEWVLLLCRRGRDPASKAIRKPGPWSAETTC